VYRLTEPLTLTLFLEKQENNLHRFPNHPINIRLNQTASNRAAYLTATFSKQGNYFQSFSLP